MFSHRMKPVPGGPLFYMVIVVCCYITPVRWKQKISIWQLCHHWWHRKLPLRRLTVPSVTRKTSNWQHFVFSVCMFCCHCALDMRNRKEKLPNSGALLHLYNCMFILDWLYGVNSPVNRLRNDNCKARRESVKFWDLVRRILEVWR